MLLSEGSKTYCAFKLVQALSNPRNSMQILETVEPIEQEIEKNALKLICIAYTSESLIAS